MLSKKEIVSRLRNLKAMPAKDRPITWHQLARASGIFKLGVNVTEITEGMRDETQARLSKAFEWLENGQLERGRGVGRVWYRTGPDEVKILPKNPPCKLEMRYQFKGGKFQVVRVATNPNALQKI